MIGGDYNNGYANAGQYGQDANNIPIPAPAMGTDVGSLEFSNAHEDKRAIITGTVFGNNNMPSIVFNTNSSYVQHHSGGAGENKYNQSMVIRKAAMLA